LSSIKALIPEADGKVSDASSGDSGDRPRSLLPPARSKDLYTYTTEGALKNKHRC